MAPKILYVEDNPENRLLIRRILVAEGYELFEAENAQELMALLEEHHPDLILVDLHLPGVDGFTIVRQLRQRKDLEHVPIVALTADVLRDTPVRCYQVGCDGYIPKPIDVDAFPKLIREFLRPVEKGSHER